MIDSLFAAVWVRSLHIAEPLVVVRIADEAGLDGAVLVAQAQQPESKARLRDQTDAAITLGVFGVPTVAVGNETFWGYDDLPFAERALSGSDLLDPGQMQRWGAVTASANRGRAPASG